MARAIRKDGKTYRMRRGKLVEIPPEWVGSTLHPQTKKKRPSKHIHKRRKAMKHGPDCVTRRGGRRHKKDEAAASPNEGGGT